MVNCSDNSKNDNLFVEEKNEIGENLRIKDEEIFDEESIKEVMQSNHGSTVTPINCESSNHSESFTDTFVKVCLQLIFLTFI